MVHMAVQITAAPGKGDEVEAVIKAVRDAAVSDAEPGSLVYRVSRYGDVRLFNCCECFRSSTL